MKLEQLATTDPESQAWSALHRRDPRPAAPFDRDPAKAAAQAFDRGLRETPISERWLQTYARVLAKYHLHPEAKFQGGDWTEAGILRRRHVYAISVTAIGKETDHLEQERGHDEDQEADNEIGLSIVDRVRLVAEIMAAKRRYGVRALARSAKVSDHTIAKAVRGFNSVPGRTLVAMAEGAALLGAKSASRDADDARLLAWARRQVMFEGRNAFARRIGVDSDNLRKIFNGTRRPSQGFKAKLWSAMEIS